MNNKYAYVTLLYPNKNKEWTYLEGAILTALGLRKQNVQNKIICMVTSDITDLIKNTLEIVYDEIIIIDYITPIDNLGIKIIKEIFHFSVFMNNENYSDICNVFTKLHIFDSNKLPYEKIIFIDNDLIPIKYFDNLFEINTPAGWLEKRIKLNEQYCNVWDLWSEIDHNQLIPKDYTDIYTGRGTSINAGLLVIKPDHDIYIKLINKLQTNKNEWFGIVNNEFKGIFDINGKIIDYFLYPEQDFLTQEFSGEWYMIDGKYCIWGERNDVETYGLHMANLSYTINNKIKYYKTWILQRSEDCPFNRITNNIAIWGLKKYPKLKSILMKNLLLYMDNKIIKFSDVNCIDFINLTLSQQKLYSILFDDDNDNFDLL